MGLYYCLSRRVYIQTTIFGIMLAILSEIGVICAAHRYWSHRSFKAEWPLRVFFMVCQTLTFQYSILQWVRIHRVHHKFSDTPRDPHNANAGLFFSHIGWILIHPSEEVTEELKKIYVDDLKKDRIVMFQHRYYIPLTILLCYILPTIIPCYFWRESVFMTFCVAVSLRLVIVLHLTGLTNSLAHMQGKKPFDKNIRPGDSLLAWFLSFGDEGWHNYHHVFPWDYKASEYWGYKGGISSTLVDFFARMGWAYDLKTTSADVTIKRRLRTGDLSCSIWGWKDPNLDSVDRALTKINYQKKP
ncbi:hypothetical protein V9T40_000504 [Parthenolecanium corni]|uniref:Fatty acid desaturase domain-containing protein n=1 Tax=Parthenolecanium corni TaxID=536013 RepID=A0AAN9TBR5_9HEMI